MSKVLLIYDDYSLLSQTQSVLKRTGFDAIGVSSEIGLSEQIISFNPDAVVAYGSGSRVNSLSVGRRLKDMVRWQGKSVLIFPQNGKPNGQDLIQARVDLVLEFPVPTERLLSILARFLGINEAQVMERFQRSEQVNAEMAQAQSKQSENSGGIFVRSKEAEAEADPFQKAMDNWVRKAPAVGGEEAPKPVSAKANNPAANVNSQSTYVQGGVSAREEFAPQSEASSAELASSKVTGAVTEDLVRPNFGHPDSQDPELAEAIQKVARDVAASKLKAKERVLRYNDKMQNLTLNKESTITRKKSKVALKEMGKDWKQEDLDHLDKLRREFTAAMFKKK